MTSDPMKRDKNAIELDRLRCQLEESVANLQSVLNENNVCLVRNQHLEAEIAHWKILCAEAERVGEELTVKANEEIRSLKESLSYMTLSNYHSKEKIEKLMKDLEVTKDNVLDQHELGFQKALQ